MVHIIWVYMKWPHLEREFDMSKALQLASCKVLQIEIMLKGVIITLLSD